MSKTWTAEERLAFGQKMAAARAAKVAPQGATEMAAPVKRFAGREDVPAGVRPIAERPIVRGREIDVSSIAGLEQAPDTGYAASSAAIEVESNEVLGGAPRATRETVSAAGRSKAILFSDSKDDGGIAQPLQAPSRAGGPVEPTGLPCSCAFEIDGSLKVDASGKQTGMASYKRGQSKDVTWCAVCGGERDGVVRPENALKGTAVHASPLAQGVQVDVEALAQRAAGMIDYEYLATLVAEKISGAK